MESGINRASIVNELGKSLHGKYHKYIPIFQEACRTDAEFAAHLIAFDAVAGQVKDTKVALPVITLRTREFPLELVENSLAHLALLSPRELLKAMRFAIATKLPSSRQKRLDHLIIEYLRNKESNIGVWHRLAIGHRRHLASLYRVVHSGMPTWASNILFDANPPQGSAFMDIRNLRNMSPGEAAAVIKRWKLSPLIVSGAMTGSKAKQSDAAVVQAGMDQMTATQLVSRTKSLEKKGVMKDEALKATYRAKASKAAKSNKATLKTSVAADVVEDEGVRSMLRELQERQIESQKQAGRGLDGNWLIIVDRSGSQEEAIEYSKPIAAAIAKFTTGKVWLVYCANDATPYDVTGMELEEIKSRTKFIIAAGGTSYGIGLEWISSHGFEVDGIVIIGDGAENHMPLFANTYSAYKRKIDKDVPVYLYQTAVSSKQQYQNLLYSGNDPRQFSVYMQQSGLTYTTYDWTQSKPDYYSIPNVVMQMSANKFGLVDRIMATKLLTREEVFALTGKERTANA